MLSRKMARLTEMVVTKGNLYRISSNSTKIKGYNSYTLKPEICATSYKRLNHSERQEYTNVS